MTSQHGFELIREENIKELQTKALLYKHLETGAQLLSLINKDENKVFGVTFRTPPADSTGVPHILEHSVLCGSRKYPVKEPFVELLKGSLQTFLNAFTYPDKTCYPVASQNKKDFYNLIDVYLDAVFHPRLTPYVFQQEGWHLELNSPAEPATIKGVVYNEMKGAYSSPDRLLIELSQQSVFPDTTYGFDSGGDPRCIPDLTYDAFMSFYQSHYHPSNARFFFYGDDDPDKRLEIVGDALEGCSKRVIDSRVTLQQPFLSPKQVTHYFASDPDEQNSSQGFITVNWLFQETESAEKKLACNILEYILIGMPASPLRKALIESGLGEDIAGAGLENELRQMYFSTGLKGVALENMAKVEALIMETLDSLVRNGIDPDTVEAAINTIEFRLRENNSGNYPQGLVIMLRALTTWLYDKDPFETLAFEAPLAKIKQQVAVDDSYFESLIEKFMLSNRHRVTVILKPDPRLREQFETQERARIESLMSGMDARDMEALVENTKKLKELQELPDPPEALAAIPTLKLADIDKRNRIIPLEVMEIEQVQTLYHDLVTHGIVYLDVGFDLHVLPQDLLPYVPLFGRALLEMGTESRDYVRLSQKISRKTGGIRSRLVTATNKDGGSSTAALFLRGKAMVPQIDELFSILKEVLLTARFDDQDRFRQILLEQKARFEHELIPNGHRLVALRLNAHYHEAGWVGEQTQGISSLFFLRDLVAKVDKDWSSVVEDLERIRRRLINRPHMLVNITVDGEQWTPLKLKLSGFLADLPVDGNDFRPWTPSALPEREGLLIPAHVNYVGKAGDLNDVGYRFHGSALVVSHFLRTSWLWDQVRVQGGAYGAFCLLDRFAKVLTFASYRDPNVLRTLRVFDQTTDYLERLDLSADELRKSVIGVIGDIDRYQLPDAKGFTSMLRFLQGDDEQGRQRLRDEVLGTTPADFKAFAAALKAIEDKGAVAILGAPEVIEKAAAEKGKDWLAVTKVL